MTLFRSLRTARFVSVAALALLALSTAAATAAVVQQRVRGRLTASEERSDAGGTFKIDLRTRGEIVTKERFQVEAWGLDATADDEGNRPAYDVVLVDADEETEADFGALRLRRNGRALFKFRSTRSDFPGDVTSFKEFAGGTIEIRAGDTVVLSGDIPEFIGIDDANEPGTRAGARTKARRRLDATDEESRAKGTIRVRAWNRPRHQGERIVLTAKRLERGAGPYTVVLVDGDTEIELGSFRARTRLGFGLLILDTRDGDTIGGDASVFDLGGYDVEVRDAEGRVVLDGTFPSL